MSFPVASASASASRAPSLCSPKILLDEPTASLDVSVRGQILDLLARASEGIQPRLPVHQSRSACGSPRRGRGGGDVSRRASSSAGQRKKVFGNPRHPYTQALLSAAPVARWGVKRERTRLKGEIGSPIDPPDACRLVGRCPLEQPSCSRKQPTLVDLGDGHSIACPIVAPPPLPEAPHVTELMEMHSLA